MAARHAGQGGILSFHRVGRATGKTMEENGTLANTYRQAGLPICVRRAPAHGEITLPLSAELTDDAVRLLLALSPLRAASSMPRTSISRPARSPRRWPPGWPNPNPRRT